MNGKDIRSSFLDFFARNEHEVVPSSSLIPVGDPTLLFTNAGMVQFKSVFLGEEQRAYSRAASSQKCVRAGGKHNDLENVGHTARHHTFFEMLGNFSFGDYFKERAIELAWEYLTGVLGLDAGRLYATVHESDDEAAELWLRKIGVPPERLLRLGDADNFWAMGDTGPCGPCSEILYDQGPEPGGPEHGDPTTDGDRYLEIWNLVFMQYNRDASGTMTPLPRPSIDTGMGLERIAAVMQGKRTNYDTDLLRPLIDRAAEMARRSYGADPADDVSLRVLADHARSVGFLIADGVLPSNEGRGYVLRRILRRAARHGNRLGFDEPFLWRLTDALVDEMGGAYPELRERAATVAKVVRGEEERFLDALARGLKVLEDAMSRGAGSVLDGETVFRLYDTYGFPDDLTRDIARERGFTIDEAGFRSALEAQRERGRDSWKGAGEDSEADAGLEPTRFVGYDALEAESRVAHLFDASGAPLERARAGDEVELIVPETPFYAEGGGQVGDRGRIRSDGALLEVLDTRAQPAGVARNRVRVVEGEIAVGDAVRLEVDRELREATRLNHSATHLLHAALREVLGDHVRQQGSLVTPDRLRFDFSHFEPPTSEQRREIERIVNEQVRANLEVGVSEEDREAALRLGVIAFFGDKYGERVRVVRMGGFSAELCGGTHARRTGDIGAFTIVSEGGVAAGTRRIEARTGAGALEHFERLGDRLAEVAAMVRAAPEDLAEKIAKLQEDRRELERELGRMRDRLTRDKARDVGSEAREVAGLKLLVSREEVGNPGELRQVSDRYAESLPDTVVVLGAEAGGKAALVVRVPDDLTGRLKAGQLMGKLAGLVGGKGGGKPTFAQGGGPDAARLADALDAAPGLVEELTTA